MWGLQISALVVFWKGQLAPTSCSGQRLGQESSLPRQLWVLHVYQAAPDVVERALQKQMKAMGPSSI